MKKVLVIFLLTLIMAPAFCYWRYETQSVKDDFGDEIRKDYYYITGQKKGSYTDKYIVIYFGESNFFNGYIGFGEKGYKPDESGIAKISLKEENGNVVTFSSRYTVVSNGYYWACQISLDIETTNKLVTIFGKNKQVKIAITYGNEKYSYGAVDCSNFIKNPKCIKEGHKFDNEQITKKATCSVEGEKTFICVFCGATKVEKILANHNFVNGVCTICGNKLNIGSIGPAGGFIFYDCDADNNTGNADNLKSSECGWRFLEAAPQVLPKRYVWGVDENLGTQTGIGTGKTNTEKIPSTRDDKTTAAKACMDYILNGYDDWFLPSKDELQLMLQNLSNKKTYSSEDPWYWSSSEVNVKGAWVYWFDFRLNSYVEYSMSRNEDSITGVRPCRRFL